MSSIASVFASPLKSVSALMQTADYVSSGNIDQNAAYNRANYLNNAIRQEVSKNFSGVGKFAYNTAMSMADSLFRTAITGGQIGAGAALAIAGTSAFSDGVISAKDRGLSDGQAFSLGLVNGVAEAAFEKIGLDALFDFKTMGQSAARYALQAALAEGGEEVGTEITNIIADTIIAGDKSEFATEMQKYIDKGDSKGAAFAKVLGSKIGDVALAGLSGALSGGGMSAPMVAGNAVFNAIGDSQMATELAEYGVPKTKALEYVKAMRKLSSGAKVNEDILTEIKNNAGAVSYFTKVGVNMNAVGGTSAQPTVSDLARGESATNREETDNLTEDYKTSVNRVILEQSAKYGEAGADIFNAIWEIQGHRLDAADYINAMDEAYYAGKNGTEYSFEGHSVEPDVARVMYEAGVTDAAIAKIDKGFVPTKAAEGVDSKLVNRLDKIANAFNVKIAFTDELRGGKNNGQYRNGTILIARDAVKPYMVVAKHEITHHLKTVAPEAFKKYADYAVKTLALGKDTEAVITERIAKAKGKMSRDVAIEELAADFTEKILGDRDSLTSFINEMNKTSEGRTTLQKIFDAISNFLKKMKEVFRGDVARVRGKAIDSLNYGQGAQEIVAQLEEAEALWKELAKAAVTGEMVQTKNTTETDGVMFSSKQEVLQWDINWDKNNHSSIKEQLIANLNLIKDKSAVVEIKYYNMNKKLLEIELHKLLKSFGKTIHTQNYGTVNFGNDEIKETIGYVNNAAEGAALLAAPYVLKRGIVISGHKNHKGFNFPSLTFAAPCILNGQKAIVGVSVQYTPNSKAHSSRVLSPDGTAFVLTEKAEPTRARSALLGNDKAISSAYVEIISQPNDSVNTQDDGLRNSEKDTEYLAAVKRGDMETAQRMVDEAAEKAGYTIKAYHGTRADFFTFDKDRVGKGTDQYGAGFYFASQKEAAKHYGNRVIGSVLKLENPYSISATNLLDAEITLTETQAYKIVKRHPMMYDTEESPLGDYYDSYWEDGPEEWMVKDLAMQYTDLGYLDSDLFRYYPNELHEAVRDVTGHDGIIVKLQNGDKFYVAWFDNQMKAADPVTYDDNGNVIPLSQRFDENEPDIRYSEKDSDIDPLEVLRKQYGTIKPGESPFRVNVEVPKKTEAHKKVSQTVRTVMEAEATPDVAMPTIEKMIAEGQFSFEVLPDDIAVNTAKAVINKHGWSSAVANWFASVSKGEVSKNNTAMGWVLYNNAVNAGDISLAMDILDAIVRHQRNAAQALQATRILKKLSPEAQMYSVQKSVQQMQEELVERYGEKAPNLKIDKKLVEEYLDQTNEDKRNDVLVRIYQDIGRQLPSTFADKWNAWRYLAMLGNPKTHIKNILGNAVFAPLVVSKNALATLIEAATYKISGGSLQRTKAIPDKELLSAAWEDYKIVADEIVAGGKYNDRANANRHIEEGRVIFKGENIVSRGLEGARVLNSKALDKEDAWFAQPHYAMALAQYCKANNISAEVLRGTKRSEQAKANEARIYAIKEAQKATYRDLNAFSQLVSSWGQKDRANTSAINVAKNAANLVVNGTIPFKKTPANILVRAVEYSPIGLVKSLTWDIAKLNNETLSRKFGEVSGAQIIDRVASGITGTMILALGFVLSKLGLVRGRGGDEEEEIYHEELMGHQGYSLEVGGISITLDWLAPESIPFFMGVNLFEAAAQKKITFADAWAVVTNLSEPMLEMSCLQGINEVFEGTAFLSKDYLAKLPAALISATTNYITQAFPTILGQAERTVQKERQTTYVTKGGLPAEWQRTLGKVSAKVPGWDYQQIPYIDAWGRLEKTPNMLSNLANNTINPAYVSSIEETDMDLELLRLFEVTGEGSVLPDRASKTFKVKDAQGNSIDKNLTAKEYVKYATMRGTAAYEMMTEMTASQEYLNLPDDEKVEVISDIYSYANAYAKAKLTAAEENKFVMTSWMSKAQVSAKFTGIPMWKYILIRNQSNNINGITVNGETYENSGSLQIMEYIYSIKGLTTEQRNALFADLDVGKKVIHYNKNLVDTKLRLIRAMANK